VIVSGPDLKRLRALADQTLVVLRQIPGAADTFLEQAAEQAQLRILIDRRSVARYGINVRDVEDVIEMAIGGKPIGTVFEGGINLSVSAAVGFISLFGVAVMSGVLYISEINRRRAEPGTSLEDAVIHGARAQLRPSLMLILVAMLGMAPAARATGIGSDIQRPLATVMVGGLLSTLFLTLLVLPSLYYLTAKKEDR
jgi:Cu/Ag efflux pump CusA